MKDDITSYFENYNGENPIEALQKLSQINDEAMKTRAYEALLRHHILNELPSVMEVPENYFSAELLKKIEILRAEIAKLETELTALDDVAEKGSQEIMSNSEYSKQKESHEIWLMRRNALLDLKDNFEKKETLEKTLQELKENLILSHRLPEVLKIQQEMDKLRLEAVEGTERLDLISKRNAAEKQFKTADDKYSLKAALFRKAQEVFFETPGASSLSNTELEDTIKSHDEVVQGVVDALARAEAGSQEAQKLSDKIQYMENAISPYKKYLVALQEFKAAEKEYEDARFNLKESNQVLEVFDASIKEKIAAQSQKRSQLEAAAKKDIISQMELVENQLKTVSELILETQRKIASSGFSSAEMVDEELHQHEKEKPNSEEYDLGERAIAALKAYAEKRKQEIPKEIESKQRELESTEKNIESQKKGISELNELLHKLQQDTKNRAYMKYALQVEEVAKGGEDSKIETIKHIAITLKSDIELSKEDKILARLEVASKLSEFAELETRINKSRISNIYNACIRRLEKGEKEQVLDDGAGKASLWSKFFDKSIYLKVKKFLAGGKEIMTGETDSMKVLADVGDSILKCDLEGFSKIKAKLEEGEIKKGGFVEALKGAVYRTLSYFGVIRKANLTVENVQS